MTGPISTTRPRKTFYKKHESGILGGTAVVITLAIWQALWSAGKISPLFMSGPSAIAKRFHDDLLHGNLLCGARRGSPLLRVGKDTKPGPTRSPA